MTGVIYKIEHIDSNTVYIGQTIQKFDKRIYQHTRADTYLGRALRKYGKEAFSFEILGEYKTEELDEVETSLISHYREVGDVFNLTDGGGGLSGYKLTEEHKEKISKAHIGIGHSEETKKKLSEIFTGTKHSEEAIKKISEASKERFLNKENCPMWGKTHSEETKRKMSEAHKGREPWNKGIKHTEETKRKMSKGQKGKGTKKVTNLTTGEVFDSITEAGEKYNTVITNIINAIRNKGKAKGCYWEYTEKIKEGEEFEISNDIGQTI